MAYNKWLQKFIEIHCIIEPDSDYYENINLTIKQNKPDLLMTDNLTCLVSFHITGFG
jgi:hypothetical protein